MTNEEAKTILKGLIDNPLVVSDYLVTALDMATKALEQQTAEDCVSRDEFERRIKPYDTEDKTDKALYNFAHNTLIGCPSVTPQPKRGKWIYTGDYFTEGMCKCSECGTEVDVSEARKFCFECGCRMDADMREVQGEQW